MKLRKNSFWNFYRDGVTQSLITKWLYCPKQCELEYYHGFVSAKQPDFFLYGNIVHHVLQRIYEVNDIPLPGNILSYLKEYDEMIGNYKASEEIQQRNEIHFVRAEAILTAYIITFRSDFHLDWQFTEEEVDVPYEFSDGKTIRLRGKLDGCHRNKRTNNVWLMDHKNYGRINTETITRLLEADFQINFYLYCVWKQRGIVADGFKYNILRVPNIKPDSRKKETIEDYRDRLYNDVLKRPDYYFHRIRILNNEDRIRKWEQTQLRPILNCLRLWWDSGFKWPGYFNPVALETKWGVSPLADFILNGNLDGLTKKERPFMELD